MAKLVFLGDYCNESNCQPRLGPRLQALFAEADAILIDIEAPVDVPAGTPPVLKVGPNLQQPLAAIATCRQWGVTHCAMANNHIMDFGRPGLESTLRALQDLTCIGAGLTVDQAYRPAYIDTPQGRIGLLVFAEAQFGVLAPEDELATGGGFAWFDHPKARALIVATRKKCDVLIVQVHAGLEFVGIPLPELRSRYREFVDLGADLIVGHHPHVFQGSECYQGKWIHYSLGNCFLDMMLDHPAASGAALAVEFDGQCLRSVLHPLQATAQSLEMASPESPLQPLYRERCAQLSDERYLAMITTACQEKWADYYEDYYLQALNALGAQPTLRSSQKFGKRLIKRALSNRQQRAQENQALLLHNIRIETHRWVVERVLANRVVPG